MLCIEDCIALSDLAHDEAAIIAEHEHLPFIVAVAKGHHLLRHPWGDAAVRQMVWDALCEAQRRRHVVRVLALRAVYRGTCHRHPAGDDRRHAAHRHTAPVWHH